ncbi:MAG: shikimate kinase [Actinomycetota bacterium]|nr:shikimate kinase [Actinomycetota bacterium]
MSGPTAPLVVLVGSPGAGKSTVGAALAGRLGVGFRDTDADVEASTGSSISDIFVDDGEQHFRQLERDAVTRALAEHEGVLCLGGGAVVSEQVRASLAGHRVVHLDVGIGEAARRVGLNTARPLLLGNVRGSLRTLLEQRRPLYESVATVTVTTDERPIEDVVEEIVAHLGARQS